MEGRHPVASLVPLLILAAGCQAAPASPAPWFVERAAAAGLRFTHSNGMTGGYSMTEIMAPGVALFDFDGDGDLDLYLVQSGPLDATAGLARGSGPARDRLYRNDLETGTLGFTDVTAASGLASGGYGMGVAAGDFDNDGRTDLYLTRFDAPNQLLRNNGDGTFRDVSRASGTDHRSWSASAAFVDVNRDGWLDLYVVNYLRYTVAGAAPCFNAAGTRAYCMPAAFPPLSDRLYVNRRDGTFEDATIASGIGGEARPGLGVSTADFDRDGWIDIYVANDGAENQLWRNRGDGTFEDVALRAGVALPATGRAEASMGVDAADMDDDGDDDIVVTELTGEGANLFVNDGSGVFEDRSAASGLGPATLAFTGFGAVWLDADHDGRLDLAAVNGTVQVVERLRQAGDAFPLHQRRQLLRNAGSGRFIDVTAAAGAAFGQSEVGRGLASGDVDNDGDTDLVVANNNGPVRLLINEAPRRHWVGLRLVGRSGRDLLGARVELTAAGITRWRRARADGSYLSASDPRVLFSVDQSTAPAVARVTWPGGTTDTFTALPLDRYTTLVEGRGR